MTRFIPLIVLFLMLAIADAALAGQAPFRKTRPDVPISGRDRVYTADQFSNTVSVVDPSSNMLLGAIRLGDPQPANFSPLYRGQVLVHGMGFAPDGRTIAVVSVGSNAVSFIDTATNTVKATTYVGRSPHEAFFTPNGREVWVTVRGENYVTVIDATTFKEIARVLTPNGPGMTIFSPDGRLAYVCSSFTPLLTVFDAKSRTQVGQVPQPSPFCPNIAASPDGRQVWYTLKDVGKVVAIDARPPFATLKVIDTGPITNHVNFADTADGAFAYVTVGGMNEVKVFRRDSFALVATIPVGKLPHGIWPSGDGSRIYVGLENGDGLAVIDTHTHKVIVTVPIGQAPQALNYVSNAVPQGLGVAGLQPLDVAGHKTELTLAPRGWTGAPPTSVSLFEQGFIQVLQAAVTGLRPGVSYQLGLIDSRGAIETLANFKTNPAGAAIVNATGPIRQIVAPTTAVEPRKLVIVEAGATPGQPVQTQR